jgi:hypothetical protein
VIVTVIFKNRSACALKESATMLPQEKTVLIIGGGVAGLSAAVGLLEANQKHNPVKFKIHIITQAHRWGGKASSWGGGKGAHVDLSMWPPNFTLNHGFHLIFDEGYYRNFWYLLRRAWDGSKSPPRRSLEELLYSNRYQALLHEAPENVICRLQAKPGYGIPGSHLRAYLGELRRHGGWSIKELHSVYDVIFREIFRYPTFRSLLELDNKVDPYTGKRYPDVGFKDWCLARGLEKSVIDYSFFKFIYDASFVSPFEMEAAAAIKTCWGVLHNFRATQWYYLQGGYTEDLWNAVFRYLNEQPEFSCTMLEELRKLVPDGARIASYESRQVLAHPDSSQPRKKPSDETLHKYKELQKSGKLKVIIDSIDDEFDSKEPPQEVDYYISTLPLENLWNVLNASKITEAFPNIGKLYTGHGMHKAHLVEGNVSASGSVPSTVATVNLQVWFQRRVTDPTLKNFIAGLPMLPAMVDYKNFLPMYADDSQWPGSILELNGGVEELCRQFPREMAKFLKIPGDPIQPTDDYRIEFAKTILVHMAEQNGFPDLKKSVEEEAFLEIDNWPDRTLWKGTRKIPPLLWWNVHESNSYFVMSPGTLFDRPTTCTKYKNLFLAGDWIRNGIDLPCMEGAARSARMAVVEILKRERCTEMIEVYDPID